MFSWPFFGKKKPGKECFFGLYVTATAAAGFVFDTQEGQGKVIASEKVLYSNGIENILEDVDKLVSMLESETDRRLEKIMFFVHETMVDKESGQIKQPYKDIFKTIAKELEFKPLGYIEVSEAVKEYLYLRDQSPLNVICVELDELHVGVYVYKGGKSMLAQTTGRTSDLADDVLQIIHEGALHTHLPSKIVLYGLSDLENDKQSLSKKNWEDLPSKSEGNLFVQPPRVEVLTEELIYQAFSDIFARQLAEDVEAKVVSTDEVTTQHEEDEETQEEEPSTGAFGFVIGKEVTPAFAEATAGKPAFVPSSPKLRKPSKTSEDTPSESEERPSSKLSSSRATEEIASIPQSPGTSIGNTISVSIQRVFSFIGKRGFILRWLVLIVVLVGLFLAFEYFVHAADVVVYVPSQEIEKEVDLNVASGSAGTGTGLSLVDHTITSHFSDEKVTTGKRPVGEKAKGEVMVLNFDNKEKVISRGTKVKTGNLSFTLDQEVQVASASGVSSSGAKQAGKSKVAATAAEIGPEYNIDKGKELQIADLPDSLYIALVETSFRGGTRKEIRTVAKVDLDNLRAALDENAKKETSTKVKGQLAADEELLSQLTEIETSKVDFSKEVGEESDTVSINATVDSHYFTTKKNDLKKELIAALKGDVPAGFRIDPTEMEYTMKDAKKDDNKITLSIEVKASAMKDVSPQEVAKAIKGKRISELNTVLKKQFEATDGEVEKTFPPIPMIISWLPFFPQRIHVIVTTK